MSIPPRSIPPRDPLGALAAELAAIGQRLDRMAAELDQLRHHGAAPQAVTTHAAAPPPGFTPPAPLPVPVLPPPSPVLPPPAAPRPALADRAAAVGGARLLAWTGAALTLLGVVLLLALAASRGWFAPPVRIAGGAALGLGLVGLGWWLHRRTARIGAEAVTATGFATLYLVIAGASAVYGYLDEVPAIALAFVVAVAGLGLADHRASRWLAHGVAIGALLLAPVLAGGWLLVTLALAMVIAASPVVRHRRWADLALVVGGLAALHGSSACGLLADGPDTRGTALATAVAALVVGLAAAAAAARRIPAAAFAALVPFAALPALVTAVVLGGTTGAWLAAGTAVALGAVAALPWSAGAARLSAATTAAVALLAATALAFDGATLTLVLLGQALVAAVAGLRLGSRFATGLATALGLVGLLRALVSDAPLADLVERRYLLDAGDWLPPGRLLTAAGTGALVVALAVVLLAACGRLGWVRADSATAPAWVTLGVVGLYGVTALVVNAALLVDLDLGFTAGHALVTVSWTVAALVLLARGITRPALRVAGMALVAAAVAKLVLFDLGALDGVSRVAAFLGAGLVLLVAGTRYARLIGDRSQENGT
ncbi:Predicted membrane protein [Pseudonocardia thermophila]|uniref:Predicted membrane protein n=1 Tax=Pseudonocardia thermophila TaxID=1848 RepID=A0A1M6QV17_PSETH|nr:DUF2339 domain-containing protein [Pseudonocardia thermophila]SHK23960.1 Predicted membrane protein [Pseudonocardia thermophila]